MDSLDKLDKLFNLAIQKITEDSSCDMLCFAPYLQNYYGDDWKQYIGNEFNSYSKYLVKSNELLDMYIITWPAKSESKIHDHPNYGCIMRILQGELCEDEYVISNKVVQFVKTNKLDCNGFGFKKGHEILHKIKNISDDVTVSLHLYSRGGYKMNLYE